jgi:Domain of unknown function (DUF4189)
MWLFRSSKCIAVAIAVSALFAGAASGPLPAAADGALAIARPPDVVKQGFAYGFASDYSDTNHAEVEALSKCRATTITGVRPLCTVIQDIKNECVAVAMDPEAGTPGVGWAVAGDLHSAEAQALSKCQETAGAGRRAACAIDHSACDGTAK